MSKHDKTILFLFGSHPRESALLEAAALAGQLHRQGLTVQLAALSSRAAGLLRDRFSQPATVARAGISWLGGLGRSRLPAAPLAVHAWDIEAAGSAEAIAGSGSPLCVTLCEPLPPTVLASNRSRAALAGASRVICHRQSTAEGLAQAGLAADRIRMLAPAVDASLLQAALQRRSAIRDHLGLAGEDAPVFTVPQLVGRDQGHFRAGWATMLLRKGDVPARLLLPEPNREAARIVRFASSCQMQAAMAIAPAATPWLDILAASDGLIVPSQEFYDPAAVAWAMQANRPVVTAGMEDEPPLLDAATSLASVNIEPLNLARALLRGWQDHAMAESMLSAASQRVRQACDPAELARLCLEAYRGGARHTA